jgi:hypothetical protein
VLISSSTESRQSCFDKCDSIEKSLSALSPGRELMTRGRETQSAIKRHQAEAANSSIYLAIDDPSSNRGPKFDAELPRSRVESARSRSAESDRPGPPRRTRAQKSGATNTLVSITPPCACCNSCREMIPPSAARTISVTPSM